MPVVFNFWSVRNIEAQSFKYLDDPVSCEIQRMLVANRVRYGRKREINIGLRLNPVLLDRFRPLLEPGFGELLKFIQRLASFFLFLGRQCLQVIEKLRYKALAT